MVPTLPSGAARAAPERERMILQYAPLVRRALGAIVRSAPASVDVEDLYSHGMMGLIDAIDRFDAARGVKFETYALVRIRGYVIDQIRASDWLPRSARARVAAVRRSSARLEERLGRRPERREIAAEAGLSRAVCDRALTESGRVLLSLDSLAEAAGEESAGALVQRLEDEQSPNPTLIAERAELRRGLLAALAELPARERLVLTLRYKRSWPLRRVALHLGISESRASQLHAQALGRMRRLLNPWIADPALSARSA